MRQCLTVAALLLTAAVAQAQDVYRWDYTFACTGEQALNGPTGLAVRGNSVVIGDTSNHRLVRFTTAGSFVDTFSCPDLGRPADVEIDGNGRLHYLDNVTGELCRVGADLTGFARSGDQYGSGFTIDTAHGTVYLIHRWSAAVITESVDYLNPIWVLGDVGWGDSRFTGLFDVALDTLGRIWFSDPDSDRVRVYSANAEVASYTTCRGVGLLSPEGMVSDASGAIFVADLMANRVFKFGQDGTQLGVIGDASGNGQLGSPIDVALDGAGRVYVLDGSETVKRFHLNRKPPAPVSVAVGPKNPTDAQNLTARPAATVDPDGDAVTFQYRWYSASGSNGPWALCARRSKVLPASYTAAGQYWRVSVRAGDGATYSGWRYSLPVRILPGAAPALACSAEAAGGGATVTVRTAGAVAVEAEILNLAGRPLALLTGTPDAGGLAVLRWNRCSGLGTRVPAGRYAVRVRVECAGGQLLHAVVPLRLQ